MLLLSFFVLLSIFFNTMADIISLRLNVAFDRLRQYEEVSSIHLLKEPIGFKLIPEQIFDFLSAFNLNNVRNACEKDFQKLIEAAREKETWALKIFDAWGKPIPSGILKGNMYWVGDYDECINLMYNPTTKSFLHQPFNTQHCTVTSTLAELKSSLVLGLCVPSSCDRESLAFYIQQLFNLTNVTSNDLMCSKDPANGQEMLTKGAVLTIIFLSLLGSFVLLGTLVDLILKCKFKKFHHISKVNDACNHLVKDHETDFQVELQRISKNSTFNIKSGAAFFAEFSMLKSLRRIFTVKEKSTVNDNSDVFSFINGVRVLSLCWVIIGHTLLFGMSYTSNLTDILVASRNIAFQLIPGAQFSVDTFFVLSGFLTAIVFFRQVKKEKKLSFRLMMLYYIHRYIRLTPAFLLVVMVSINLTPYFGHGPVYPTQQGFETIGCRTRSWWTSILYVGNIVRPDDMCLNIAWYLHNDMQFHWIAPLSLIPFVLGRKTVSIFLTSAFILVGIGSILSLLLYYPELVSSDSIALDGNDGPTFFNTIYIKPWCRISAYAVGLLTGYMVIITGRQYSIKRYWKYSGTILALALVLICLFGTYPNSIHVPGLTRSESIAYSSLSRTIWSISISWLLFLCSTGQGGMINQILSWSIWTPLARLNYSCYLIHSMVIYISIFNQHRPFYYQGYLIVNNFVSNIFFSYAAAIVVNIFFETPFFILEKKLLKR